MDPRSPKLWSKLLWDYFAPQIASGRPVFLTVGSRLLTDLLHGLSKEFSYLNATEAFLDACRALFSSVGQRLVISPAAYESSEKGHTCAIVLAAHQVLVVESMIDDPTGSFSADSYFPRYRHLLGLAESDVHLNPIAGNGFVHIWNVLAEEMLAVKGANERTITFSKGTGRKNLNRNLPISQALFSLRDLAGLAAEIEHIGTGASLDDLFHLLSKHKWLLTARGRKLLANKGLRGQLCDQFRSFINDPRKQLLQKQRRELKESNKDALGILVLVEESKGFRQRYALQYWIDFEDRVSEKEAVYLLQQRCGQGDLLVLTRDIRGYSEPETRGTLHEGDAVVFVSHKDDVDSLGAFLEAYLGASWNRLRKELVISEAPQYCFFLFDKLPCPQAPIAFDRGRITATAATDDKLVPQGGLLIDKNRKLYVAGYPPSEFYYGGKQLTLETAVTVNAERSCIGEMLEHLKTVTDFESITLEYQGESAQFYIVNSCDRPRKHFRIGFGLEPDRLFSPSARRAGEGQDALTGWAFPADDKRAAHCVLAAHELAWLMGDSDFGWVNVAPTAIERLAAGLDRAAMPPAVREAIQQRMRVLRKLPAPLVLNHQLDELASGGSTNVKSLSDISS